MKQRTLASLEYAQKKQQTRKEKCLSEMERRMPWEALMAVIAPRSPSVGRRGGEPIGWAVMPRIYLVRQWSGLSDPLREDSLYEVASMGHLRGWH